MWDLASAWPEKRYVSARPGSEPGLPVAQLADFSAKPRGWPKMFLKIIINCIKSTITHTLKRTNGKEYSIPQIGLQSNETLRGPGSTDQSRILREEFFKSISNEVKTGMR